MQISADGAMVPLLRGQWAEVRTLVIGEVRPAVQERGEWVVHTRNLYYFSRKISSEAFERLALVEIQWWGVENARQVAAVMDGLRDALGRAACQLDAGSPKHCV